MAVTKQVTCIQVALTTSSGATPISLGGVRRVILHTSADCYVDFDQPVAPTQSFKLLSSNTADTTIELDMGLITNLYAQAITGTGTLYIVSIVG